MSREKCDRCNGTGYSSAAKESGTENAHWTQVQYGVFTCPTCNGSGEIGLDPPIIDEAIKASIERAYQNWLKRGNHEPTD